MAHGQPDFGMYSLASTIHKIADMGELGVRLGSIDTFDRRGDIVFLDDFEGGIQKWDVLVSGLLGSLDVSTAYARNGMCSAELVAGSNLEHRARMVKATPYIVRSRFGLECSFIVPVITDQVNITLGIYTGTHYILGGFKYDDTNHTTSYYTTGDKFSGAHTIPGISSAYV